MPQEYCLDVTGLLPEAPIDSHVVASRYLTSRSSVRSHAEFHLSHHFIRPPPDRQS